jgi:ribose transport system substrate-binding protein
MKRALGLLAATAFAVAATAASAEDKVLAIVVKGLDNPFFEQIHLGCEKANAELAGSGYTCLYTGPASSADEAGEVQIVDDLITKGVAAIAISPSNAPMMANLLKQRAPNMPIMTIDADLGSADAGTRDTLAGEKGVERLTGQGGWTEVDGCPLYTNDQADLANQQMADTFLANPDLDAFVLEGGWAQFAPQAYAQVTDQVMDKMKSGKLIIVAGDTLPPQIDALKAGRSHAQVGQRPFEMGYKAPFVMRDLVEGKTVEPVLYTGLDECTQENVDTCIAK